MVKSNMMRRKNNSVISHEPFEFFSLKGRLRFKASEIAVSQVMAILSDLKWLEEELREI